MAETDDANTLVSTHRHPMELVYADYANAMKDMANKARIAIADTGKVAYSREAKSKYEGEVKSLLEKLNNAEKNAVRERAAQRIANANINEKLEANPDMKAKDKKKVSQQALSKARLEVGSVKRRDRNIVITDNEWEAIQAGAVSETILKRILNNSDPDSLRAKAMPKESSALSDVKIARIKAMSASYTIAQIADKLGYSTSTISKALKGGN